MPPPLPARSPRLAPLLAILGVALLLARLPAPAAGPERAVELALALGPEHAVLGPGTGDALGSIFPGPGWSAPEPEGRWALAPGATTWLLTASRHPRLRLVLSGDPRLRAAGQRYQVALDGRVLHEGVVPPGWSADSLEIALPPRPPSPALARLVVSATVAADTLASMAGEARPLGVFVRSIQLAGRPSPGAWASLDPALPQGMGAARSLEGTPGTTRATADAPDILLVVLDALRADRVHHLGHPRPTTPTLDSLAATGVSWPQLWSTAPYTRSAMATLLTGRSWRDHQVVGPADALSPRWPTLATALAAAGWHTLGISDNANLSRSAGSDLGFARWVESWRDPRAGGWKPWLPVELFAEELVRGLPDGPPAFALVHLMPPHQPYRPSPPHDRFTDPSYEGPVDGSHPVIQAFDRGELPRNPADQRQLEGLYDGNLHEGDALVAALLDHWRGLGRSRPLLVLVLSDHGEGFGERGRYSHNSTVFPGMLRVPLVASPRSLVPSLATSGEGWRSLEDVLPLLLRDLGLPLPAGPGWPPLAHSLHATARSGRSRLAARAAPPRLGWYGPGRSLLVLQRGHSLEWYPSATGPAAAPVGRRPAQALLELDRWWRLRDGGGAATQPGLDEADRERLRALGYTGG